MDDFWYVIRSSLARDAELWRGLLADPASLPLRGVAWVVILAGLSEAAAQSVALVLNKVSFRRFLASLLLNAVIFALGFVFYVLSISLTTRWLYGTVQPPLLLVKSVSLAYAPLILSFFSLIPYFGRAVMLALSVYHFFAVVTAVTVTYTLTESEAFVSTVAGFVLLVLLRGTVGRPLTGFSRWLKNRTAGVQLRRASELLPAHASSPKLLPQLRPVVSASTGRGRERFKKPFGPASWRSRTPLTVGQTATRRPYSAGLPLKGTGHGGGSRRSYNGFGLA